MRKTLPFLLIILLASGAGYWAYAQRHAPMRDVNELRFSNTQVLLPEYGESVKQPSIFTDEQLAGITLPPPPANDSEQTAEELKELHAKEALRTPEKMQEILAEDTSLQKSVFGTTTLETYINPRIRPHTSELVDFVFAKTAPVIMMQKLKYDRVRASYLDPTLTTAIDVPRHPSYPSGHSTHMHELAAILSRLDPDHTALYFDSAERIAINREIAGVHYPSDTEGGRLLAIQIVDLLFQNQEFLDLYAKAQSEWQ
jgi:acid phosphatase (class A)